MCTGGFWPKIESMKETKRQSEYQMYLQAGQRLIVQGDLVQAEKILKSGLKKLDEHLMDQNELRMGFLSSLSSLGGSTPARVGCGQDVHTDQTE